MRSHAIYVLLEGQSNPGVRKGLRYVGQPAAGLLCLRLKFPARNLGLLARQSAEINPSHTYGGCNYLSISGAFFFCGGSKATAVGFLCQHN